MHQQIMSWVGQGLDYDGYYGNQCVDLVNFLARYLGTGPFSGPTALNLVAPAGWHWVANTPAGVPPEGAVVKANYAPAGHVFIALAGATTNNIPCIEQNWNGIMRVTQGNHDYSHVLGWWVRDGAPPAPVPVAAGPAGQRSVPINVPIVNVRTAPSVSAPIVGSLHQGYCIIQGTVPGDSGTVGSHTSSEWGITLNGHFFNMAATQ
jgi:hypothetical protein